MIILLTLEIFTERILSTLYKIKISEAEIRGSAADASAILELIRNENVIATRNLTSLQEHPILLALRDALKEHEIEIADDRLYKTVNALTHQISTFIESKHVAPETMDSTKDESVIHKYREKIMGTVHSIELSISTSGSFISLFFQDNELNTQKITSVTVEGLEDTILSTIEGYNVPLSDFAKEQLVKALWSKAEQALQTALKEAYLDESAVEKRLRLLEERVKTLERRIQRLENK